MYFLEQPLQPPPGIAIEYPDKTLVSSSAITTAATDPGPFASCVFLGLGGHSAGKGEITGDQGWPQWLERDRPNDCGRRAESQSTAADAREFQFGLPAPSSQFQAEDFMKGSVNRNEERTRKPSFDEFEASRLTDRLAFLMGRQGHQTIRDPDCPFILLIVAQGNWLPLFIKQNEPNHGTIYSRFVEGKLVRVDDTNRGTPAESEDGCTTIQPHTSVIGNAIACPISAMARRAQSIEIDCRLLQMAGVGQGEHSAVEGFATIIAEMIEMLRRARRSATAAVREVQASAAAYTLIRQNLFGSAAVVRLRWKVDEWLKSSRGIRKSPNRCLLVSH
ncbi:hypothetical protein FOZ61_006042, partial [Perkinsus olseni]